jgi:hypothetical protein
LIWTVNGHCYFKAQGADASWATMRDACIALGAHLVTITSAEEQTFAQQFLGGNHCWIGMSRTQNGDPLTWVNGETFDGSSYTNWAAGEPSIATQTCVRMRSPETTWNTRSCSNNYGGICERE